jgi:hypothetical protein
MNGRVQDAITGRFLSPDPYITEPGNTQNFNRYGYVYNNPMSLVDPSGFAAQSCNTYTVVVQPASVNTYDDGNGHISITIHPQITHENHECYEIPDPPAIFIPTGIPDFFTKLPTVNVEPDTCKNSANAPKGLAATNQAFRNNTDPNKKFTVDASQLTVKQTSNFDSNGRATGVVQGSDWLVYGQVTLQQNPGGSVSIRPDRYNFEQHDVSKYSSPLRGAVRNVETYFGFYTATYGGLTEYWADITGGNHATDFTSDFTCQPTVVR